MGGTTLVRYDAVGRALSFDIEHYKPGEKVHATGSRSDGGWDIERTQGKKTKKVRIEESEYDRVSIEAPGVGTVDDGRLEVIATLGWRAHEGRPTVAEFMRIDETAFPGLVGTHLEPDPRETAGPAVQAWVSYHAIRLLDDSGLEDLIPLGKRFDYVSVGSRADFHVAPGLGARVMAAAGMELQQTDLFFSAEAGLTWRPNHRTEFTLVTGFGTAQGRVEDTNSLMVKLGFTHRW